MKWNPIGCKSQAHSNDIKGIARISNDKFVSTGRDGSVKLWKFDGDEIIKINEYKEHEGFINSIAFIPSTPEYTEGLILSGGNDRLINIWDCKSEKLYGTLIGHTENICKLTVFPDEKRSFPFIFGSCSWDGSARCWTSELSPQSSILLKPENVESGTCFSVISLGPDSFITGHADKSIRIWRGEREVQVISDAHTDVVRDLISLEPSAFLSVSNDGSIKIWDSRNAELLQTVPVAHNSFIYGIINENDLIVSFGEEGILKIWKWNRKSRKISLEEELTIPMLSIWSVSFLSIDRIVIGGSNGSIYLFSSDENSKIFEKFQDEVQLFNSSRKKSQNLNVQHDSVLRYPGERTGKTLIVRNSLNNKVEAHQWDGNEWQNLGEVVDEPSPDFSFKVQLDDTGSSYDLPYNSGENPYTVARIFLEKNDLPITHLDEVANFIIKNAGVGNHQIDINNTDSSPEKSKIITEPSNFVIEAFNSEGILKKLKIFGFKAEEIKLSDAIEILKTWPIEKLFPCLDWLRVYVLLGNGNSFDQEILVNVPFEEILEKGTKTEASKETFASVTMTLRLLCNISSKSIKHIDQNLIVKIIGKCSQCSAFEANYTTWLPLLIGLLYNCKSLLDSSKKMALLHAILSKISANPQDDQVQRIYWLVKEVGKPVPLSTSLKKEFDRVPNLKMVNELI